MCGAGSGSGLGQRVGEWGVRALAEGAGAGVGQPPGPGLRHLSPGWGSSGARAEAPLSASTGLDSLLRAHAS